MDIRLVMSPIAGVQTDTFTEEFLDGWLERIFFRQGQVREGEICRGQATLERRCVIRLRSRNFLNFETAGPEAVGDESLLDSALCQLSVGPVSGSVAIEQAPVAVPSRSSIV